MLSGASWHLRMTTKVLHLWKNLTKSEYGYWFRNSESIIKSTSDRLPRFGIFNKCQPKSEQMFWEFLQLKRNPIFLRKKSSNIKFLFINKNQTRNTCKLAEALFITRRIKVLNKKTFCPISLMIFSIQIFKGQTFLSLIFPHAI